MYVYIFHRNYTIGIASNYDGAYNRERPTTYYKPKAVDGCFMSTTFCISQASS